MSLKKLNKVINNINDYHNARIEKIKNYNPSSYKLRLDDFFGRLHLSRDLLPEFYPELDEKCLNYFKDNISFQDFATYYHKTDFQRSCDKSRIVKNLVNKFYPNVDFGLFEAIQAASCNWIGYDRFDDESTFKIFNSIHSDLSIPFGDQRFSVKPIYSNMFCGFSDNSSLFRDKDAKYKVRHYCDEQDKYIEKENNRLFLDSRLGLVFYFKNKPAFYVSFYIDQDMNVFIRQIQGCQKGRGHYVLGDKWRTEVVQYLKDSLSFANDFYVITEDAAFDFVIATYAKNSVKDVVLDTVRKASSVYSEFKNENVFHQVPRHLSFGFRHSKEIKDTFYLF